MNREREDVIRILGVIAENLESRLAPGSAGVRPTRHMVYELRGVVERERRSASS